MPSVGRFPCDKCEYVATNRRMLSRHVVVAHSDKVYQCPMCPFITRYAANWYRHKRGIHGLSKLTTCEVCGFFAGGVKELNQHIEFEHPEHHELRKLKDQINKSEEKHAAETITNQSLEDGEHNGNASEIQDSSLEDNVNLNDSIAFSLPLNGSLFENEVNLQPEKPQHITAAATAAKSKMDFLGSSYGNLSPPKIRRSYCCNLCGLLTSNPREFLYHQRDIHNMRINVFECRFCIYASKHAQKLQRHYGLVHRQKMPAEDKPPAAARNVKKKNITRHEPETVEQDPEDFTDLMLSMPSYDSPPEEPVVLKTVKRKRENPDLLKCAACDYQTRNKYLLIHHERTVHMKKKFFHCDQCSYVTSEKARYTKHIKYHNLPKTQCEFCNFKSAYKWNMDRHMKNHATGKEGEYGCSLCSFITHSKVSLKMHMLNHHTPEESESVYNEDSLPGDLETPEEDDTEWTDNFQVDEEEQEDVDEMGQSLEECQTPGPPSTAFSRFGASSNLSWSQETSVQKLLQCSSCDFQTKWSFQMRKHEEIHKSKRHSCPLCGMRFEHLAWLTKHLNRVHKGNAQASSIANALEQMKPVRRRPSQPGSTKSFSVVSNSSRPYEDRNGKTDSGKQQSVLSSLLRNSGPARYSPMLPKMDSVNSKPSRLPLSATITRPEENQPLQMKESAQSPQKVPCCKVCGYRTKWISELEKHMRVHSDDKPFRCSKCTYHSKWKGDLTRHMLKHHNIILPMGSRKVSVPKIKLKSVPNASTNKWQTVKQASATTKREESPLDLTFRSSSFSPATETNSDPEDELQEIDIMNLETEVQSYELPNASKSSSSATSNSSQFGKEGKVSQQTVHAGKKKYHCPFCSFVTSTPSRFHVHIVQHYNKKPFMCSLCGHRSNWEWDITKHIRLRGSKDKEHSKACVLLTDETGRRNYEKYEKYLKEPDATAAQPHEQLREGLSNSKHSTRARETAAATKDLLKEVSLSSNEAVNIVVTPDINFTDDVDNNETMNYETEYSDMGDNMDIPGNNFKFYLCKHCNYKHSSRKVVVSHLSVHAGVRPYRCRVCGLTANWRHIIVRHVKVAHNGYMNDVEDRIAYTQEGFVIRITSVKNSKSSELGPSAGSGQYTCKFCPYNCDKEVYIKFHMKQHKPREGAIYQCTFCPYYVKFKKTLVRHMKLHEPPTPPSTHEFDNQNGAEFQENESFADADNYLNFLSDGNEYDYSNANPQLGYEDSIAISFNQLKMAEPVSYSSPTKLKKHVCEHCPYRTDNRTQYLYHKQFHRPNSSAPFKCALCSYWATMQHLLTQHMRVHGREYIEGNVPQAPIDAGMLPNEFAVPQTPAMADDTSEIPMVVVQREGVSTKMFKCRFCPMMNKKRANVRVHERMHGTSQGVGKYTCSLCNYKCLGQGSLTNHMKIHQNSDFEYDTVQPELPPPPSLTTSPVLSRKKVFSYFCMRCPAVFKSSSDLYIHRTFHGSNLPYACPQCDYRAKHKPHLQKHLQVHTAAYISKRDASCGPPVDPDCDKATDFLNSDDKPVIQTRECDQMLLLEVAEIKMYLRRGKAFSEKRLHKCPLCPSYFAKPTVLAYHCSQHGGSGEFGCSQCNYATTRSMNLAIHSQVHSKNASPVKRSGPRVMQCPKCPASFNKTDRFERHLGLHGKNYRYVCDLCDYSVNFAANLSKHKYVHLKDKNLVEVPNESSSEKPAPVPTNASEKSQKEDVKVSDAEEKKYYMCDRCPYYQARKDAVQSHQQRHCQKEGFPCPYCDYRSMGSSFLREHVKSHFQPNTLFQPHTYMKLDKFKIFIKEADGTKTVLFEDKGKSQDVCSRFFPPVQDREQLTVKRQRLSDGTSSFSSQKDCGISDKALSMVQLPKVLVKDIFSKVAEKPKKLENGSFKISAPNMPPKHDKFQSVPVSNQNSEKPSTTKSIIVKIRVDNNNDRSLYTISKQDINEEQRDTDKVVPDTETIVMEKEEEETTVEVIDLESQNEDTRGDLTKDCLMFDPNDETQSCNLPVEEIEQDIDVNPDSNILEQLNMLVSNVVMNSTV